MNTLEIKIQEDFIVAMKCKDAGTKLALQGLKTKITEAQKENGNGNIDDVEIIKIVTKMVKQREESILQYKSANRGDLAEKEEMEIKALSKYMPRKFSDDEIRNECTEIIENFKSMNLNQNALVGKTIGEFNKKHPGMADVNNVRNIIQTLI